MVSTNLLINMICYSFLIISKKYSYKKINSKSLKLNHPLLKNYNSALFTIEIEISISSVKDCIHLICLILYLIWSKSKKDKVNSKIYQFLTGNISLNLVKLKKISDLKFINSFKLLKITKNLFLKKDSQDIQVLIPRNKYLHRI